MSFVLPSFSMRGFSRISSMHTSSVVPRSGDSLADRLIYSWDTLAVDGNDRAVEYLHEIQPAGLDLEPLEMALACRHEKCRPEDVFAPRPDLVRQCENAVGYISAQDSSTSATHASDSEEAV